MSLDTRDLRMINGYNVFVDAAQFKNVIKRLVVFLFIASRWLNIISVRSFFTVVSVTRGSTVPVKYNVTR